MRRDTVRLIESGRAFPEVLDAPGSFFEAAASDWRRRETTLRRSEAFLAQAQRLTNTGSRWWKLIEETLSGAIRDDLPVDLEHRLLMPNGSVKHVRVVLQNVASESEPPEFIGAATDITERKQAKEQLRKS
jgi:hypothetical protein